jgi:hypothetical protein
MLAFQGVAALPIVVARFGVTGAIFLFSFQALPGGWRSRCRSLEAVTAATVSAVARRQHRRLKN